MPLAARAAEGQSSPAAVLMTADGVVTLRGPMDSLAEKTSIATLARSTEGAKTVVDEIEVKAE